MAVREERSLQDILTSRGLEDKPPSEHCSLLRACLHNIKIALDLGHVSAASVQDLFGALLDNLEIAGWDTQPPHVDQVYVELAALLARADPALFFSRSSEVVSYLTNTAISLQPSWAFKYWLQDNVHEARTEEHQYADVIALTRAFAIQDNREPNGKLGTPLLWLTPNMGTVAELVAGAFQAQFDGGEDALEAGNYAQRLRDLLGLERRYFPEHAVAAVSSSPIGSLRRPGGETVVGDESMSDLPRVAAPTQFDACDYPVFRHWPTAAGDADADYGRTWYLASEEGAGRTGGAPELISDPLDLASISKMVPLGQIRAPSPTEDEKVAFAARFADEICGAETIVTLVATLGRLARI